MEKIVEQISELELKSLSNKDLIERMDYMLSSSFLSDNLYNMRLNVKDIMSTKKVISYDSDIQRKIAYKTFGMISQILYTHLAINPNFDRLGTGKKEINKQFAWGETKQWIAISSRIIAEYFILIIYLIGTGKDLNGKSKFRAIKNWLKTPGNEFVYFAISIARAKKYSRKNREDEVHAKTKIAKKILTMSTDTVDNTIFNLINIITNQWQFLIDISNDKNPNGYTILNDELNDKRWYEEILKGDFSELEREIDIMMDE